MKKIMLLAAGVALSVLCACSTTGTKPSLTPAQFIAIACPPVQTALALAPTVGTLSAPVLADVAAANQVVGTACAAGATVSIATVGDFAKTVLPAASEVIGAVPDSVFSSDPTTAAQKKAAIQGGIAIAVLAVDTVVAVQANAAAAASAPVSTVPQTTPASAPLAA